MAYVIGTDEAGYGPNLGPLVIAATLWQVPDDLPPTKFSGHLMRRINRHKLIGSKAEPECRFVIADSKQLYQAGGSISPLESGVLSAVASCSELPRTGRKLWASLAPESESQLDEHPCLAVFDAELPTESLLEIVERNAQCLCEVFDAGDIRLQRIAATALFPAEFNRRTAEYDSKGTTLSRATIGLIGELLGDIDPGDVSIVCDKHGGRNRYNDLLQQQFPDSWIEVRQESRPKSVYRFSSGEQRVEICFRTSGEDHAASALASMTAKYLRELSMAAFNRFWRVHLPELRPTAGYPVDARRFKAAIATVQQELGIDDRSLWRTR